MQKGISLYFHSIPYRAKINGSKNNHIRDGKICSINKEESIPLTDEATKQQLARDICCIKEGKKN